MRLFLSAALALLVVAACGSSSEPSPAPGSTSTTPVTPKTQVVGPTGGTVETGGAAVTIPAGALSGDTSITIEPAPAGLAALPEGVELQGQAVAFLPHGTKFLNDAAVIKLPFSGEANTVVRLADPAATTWEEVPGAAFADGVATFATTRFSIYAVANNCMGICKSAPSSVCATPNVNKCSTACRHVALRSQQNACAPVANKLTSCYLSKKNDAAAWDCTRGFGWPKDSTCQAEYAAADACIKGVKPPAACSAQLAGTWQVPNVPGAVEQYVTVLADRVLICASDGKGHGVFKYTCDASGTLASDGAVCGFDEGTKATLSVVAGGVSWRVTNAAKSRETTQRLAGVDASVLPSWCTDALAEGRALSPVPTCQ